MVHFMRYNENKCISDVLSQVLFCIGEVVVADKDGCEQSY